VVRLGRDPFGNCRLSSDTGAGAELRYGQRRQLQLQDAMRRRQFAIQCRTYGGAMPSPVRAVLFRVLTRRNPIAGASGRAANPKRCSFRSCSFSACAFGRRPPPHQLRSIWLPPSRTVIATDSRTKLCGGAARNPPDREGWNQQDRLGAPPVLSLCLTINSATNQTNCGRFASPQAN
jgi:hypothetical protein